MKLIWMVVPIGLFFIIKGCLSRSCFASLSTIEYVESCPTNEQEWMYREKLKNCQNVEQDCTPKHRFVYHCSVNEWINATVEVCAPIRIVFGHCVEFNVKAARIQYNHQSCRGFKKPCPVHYDSTDVYKYPKCFRYQQPSKPITEIIPVDELKNTREIISVDESKNIEDFVDSDEIDSGEDFRDDDRISQKDDAEKISKNEAIDVYREARVSALFTLFFLFTFPYVF